MVSLCLLVFSSSIVLARQTDSKPELNFQRIYEGLVSNKISAVYQDKWGYIWVGTYSGLHRFDGIQFHIYSNSSDSTTISNNYIGAIYEDEQDELWFGTISGMARYNRDTDDFTRFDLPNARETRSGESALVNTILEDKNGILWISAGTDGLYYFDREKQQFNSYGNFEGLTVSSVTTGHYNDLWVATTEKGLANLDIQTGEVEYYNHDPSDPRSVVSNTIDQVKMDPDGNLWVGTRGSGLDRMVMEDGKAVFYHYRHEPGNPNSLGNDDIFTLYIDNEDNLWVGNENGGLHLYNKTSDSFYRYESNPENPNSLTHNSIWSIFQDRNGRYWVGTAHSGLDVADRFHSKFTHYFSNSLSGNSLNNDVIRDFQENNDGNIWVATDGGGLNLFNRKNRTFKAYRHNPNDPRSLGSDAVISLDEDDKGNLWVGTWAGGLNILPEGEENFTTFNEWFNQKDFPIRSVFDFHFEGQYLWIAAFEEGLYRYDTEHDELRLYEARPEDPEGLVSHFILRVFEDSGNNLWIGTQEGLSVLRDEDKEEGIFRRYVHSDNDSASIAGNAIHQILEDRNRNIWIATDKGLSRYIEKEDRFQNFYQSDGLPADEIRSIVEDDNGILWIGTIQGISRFNPIENTFTNYHKNDGLQSNEFSRYSVHKTRKGELLFGGMAGFNLFHPDDVASNPNPPPVYLTDFKLFNSPVDIKDPESPLQKHISVTDTLVLSYQHSVITFDFIALNYTRPEHNQYAYMVEGFEDDWNYVGTQRNATYTNLSPGEYTFRVKASNNDGIWNEEGASVKLIITPPFWQTAWFYLLAAIFITGITITAYRLRVRSISEHNRKLEQQVADRTNELKEKNNDLKAALKELEDTKDELVEKAHKAGMADIATGVIHNVGNILNSVNTSAELIKDSAKKSKVEKLSNANAVLREHIDRLDEFIAKDPKGKKLMEYYLALEEPLKKEKVNILEQSDRLINKINLISEVISAQQSYVGADTQADQTSLLEMIENALALQAGSIERHGLVIEKNLQATAPVIAQRSKLIHVLVNIFKNAKEAMNDNSTKEKKIIIKTWQDDQFVYLSVTDNGPGIKKEHLSKIFTHGFTTKKNGHGFGLHNSAISMNEMGGKIEVDSEGEGKGTTFTLSLPNIETSRIDLNHSEKDKQNGIPG